VSSLGVASIHYVLLGCGSLSGLFLCMFFTRFVGNSQPFPLVRAPGRLSIVLCAESRCSLAPTDLYAPVFCTTTYALGSIIPPHVGVVAICGIRDEGSTQGVSATGPLSRIAAIRTRVHLHISAPSPHSAIRCLALQRRTTHLWVAQLDL
jgi:hypothetical protein